MAGVIARTAGRACPFTSVRFTRYQAGHDAPAGRHAAVERLSGPRPERRLPAAELLPAVGLELAGGRQGHLPRPRRGGLALRPGDPLARLRDAAAERRGAQAVRTPGPPAAVHAVQRLSTRPLQLPVLPQGLPGERADLRPPGPPLARREDELDQHPHRLHPLQPAQGQPPASRVRDAAGDKAVRADLPPAPSQRPLVPAGLPAPELARLPLLGRRARPVTPPGTRLRVCPAPKNLA